MLHILYPMFREPSPAEQAQRDRREAEIGLLAASKQREYYEALEQMHRKCLARLDAESRRRSNESLPIPSQPFSSL